MKTIKQLLITIAVLLCSVTAHAQYFDIDGISYRVTSTGNLTVSVAGASNNLVNILIPPKVNYNGKNYTVNGIADFAFDGYDNITSISIPESITEIGRFAFRGCSGIISIEIPNSVNFISKGAFSSCTSLRYLHIEDGESLLGLGYENIGIGGSQFSGCPLETLYLGRNLNYECTYSGGYSPFYNKQLLYSLTIGNNVTNIRENAFFNCSGITSVIIPENVVNIEVNAFKNCTNLNDIYYTSVTPPTSLWLANNTYVPNEDAYSKSVVSGGNGNFIEYVTFHSTTFTYGETPETTFTNNLEDKSYTATAIFPELPNDAGTHTVEIPFTFSNGEKDLYVNIPYTYTINKAPLVVETDTIIRSYGEHNPEFVISYSGFVYGENDDVLTNKGTASTSATVNSDVGEYAITISGVTADNYEILYGNSVLIIKKVPLTVVANNAIKIYGDNNPQFTLSFSGLKNNDTYPKMITEFSVNTNATKASSVGEYDIVVSGGEAKNYEIVNYINGKLTIAKAPMTVIANNATRVYGDENPSLDFSCSGLKNNDAISTIFSTYPVLYCSADIDSDTGDYGITISKGEAYNYDITDYVNGTLTVIKAPLILTANDATRLYGDENPSFNYYCVGLKNDDLIAEIFDVYPQVISDATITSPVGEYAINIIGGESQNYEITNTIKGWLTINKAYITVAANNATKVYGDENPEFSLTFNGLKNDETYPEMTNPFNISTDATEASSVGEYDIVVSGGEVRNYEIANYIDGVLEITKSPLSVIANKSTKVYGDENPTFDYTCVGLKNDDEQSSVFEILPVLYCAANETSNVGNYTIEINGASSNNYEIIYENGILTIDKRNLNVTTNNYTRTYGVDNPVFEILYDGFVNNDNESSLLMMPEATTDAEIYSDVGSYVIEIGGGDADNYFFTYINANLIIEKADQIITWEQEFSDLVIGSQIELTATATSGLDIEYILPDNDFVSVYNVGNIVYLDCYAAGDIVIRAAQDGDKNYNAAERISKIIKITTVNVSEITAEVSLQINGNNISLSNANNSTVAIYNINGVLVKKIDKYTGEEIILEKGVYIVSVGNKTIKIKL